MPFEFPNAPITGDKHTEFGVDYVWDGSVWNLAAGGDMTEYVLKAGDIMTGGLLFGSEAVTDSSDLSRHISLYGTTFGFSITSGRLNYNVGSASNLHEFNVAGVNTFQVHGTGAHVLGNLGVDGYLELNGGNLYIDRTASGYGDSPYLEFRRGSSWTLRLFGTVSNNSGFGDWGGFRMLVQRGSYGTQRIMETLPGQGDPTLITCPIQVPEGSITLGSGDNWGVFLGDIYHGWVWSNTSNCEHLRSYQGKFEFRKANAVLPGELLATIDTAGVTTNMFNASSKEAIEIASELSIELNEYDGVDIIKVMASILAKIKHLETELVSLKKPPTVPNPPRPTPQPLRRNPR